MDETETLNIIIKQAKSIRNKIDISNPEIQNYLNYQNSKLSNNRNNFWASKLCYRPKSQVNKSFRRAFNTLTKLQQAELYLLNVTNLFHLQNDSNQISTNQFPKSQLQNSFSDEIISIILEIADGKSYKKLTEVSTKIIPKTKIMRIESTQQQIDLHHYLLRKSRNKNKNVLVLQSTETFIQTETVRINFNSINFQDSYNLIYNLWTKAQYQNLQNILNNDKTSSKKQIKEISFKKSLWTDFGQKDETSKILTQKVLSNSLRDGKTQGQLKSNFNKSANIRKSQNMLVSSNLIQSLNSFQNFEEQSFGVFYSQDKSKVRRIFNFPKDSITLTQIKNMIEDIKQIKNRKESLIDIKLLNSIPSQRTSIIREVCLLEGKQYQFIYFRNYFTVDNVSYFIQKSIDLEQFKNKNKSLIKTTINNCIWKIQQIGNNIQILVQANIIFHSNIQNKLKIVQNYIGDFSYFTKTHIKNQNLQKTKSQVSFDSNEFQDQFLSMISDSENFVSTPNTINNTYFQTNTPNMLKNNFKNLDHEFNSSDSGNKETATQSSNTQTNLKNENQQKPKSNPEYLKQPHGHIQKGQKWKVVSTGELEKDNIPSTQQYKEEIVNIQRQDKNLRKHH